MKTYNKMANLIDILSISVITFLLSFVWIKFYIKNITLSILISLIISIFSIMIIRKINTKKLSKYATTKAENEKIQSISNTLILGSFEDNLIFLNNLFPESKIEDFYIVTHNSNIIIPKLDCLEFTTNDLLTILKNKKINQSKSISIITQSVNKACIEYASNLSIKINFLQIEDIAKLTDTSPIPTITITPKKHNTILMIAKMFIARKNVKGYIISAIFIIFSSIIVPYKTYYLVFASLLLILALISVVANKEDKTQQKKDAV